MRNFALAALAAFALLCPRAAFAQYELAGSLTSTTCNDTGGGAVAQETGCLVMNLAPAIGSVSVQVTANADTLQFEVTDSSTWVSANAYPLPSGPAVTSTTANGIWQVDTAGARRFRVRASAGAAATVVMMASLDSALASGGTQSVTGTGTAGTAATGVVTVQGIAAMTPLQVQGETATGAAPGSEFPLMMGAFDTANMQKVQSDTSGRLKVVGAAANGAAVSGNPVLVAGGSVAGATNATVMTVKAASTLAALTDTGLAVTFRENVANDTTAISNGIETHPAVARAGPSSTTAGRSEKLQSDTVSGGIYVSETPTTNATGLTTTGITTVTASQSIKASAGNLYGFGVVNGAGAGCWLQCVNSSGAGTLGTAVIFQAPIPTSGSVYQSPGPIPLGSFSTGIACGMASAVNGASACGTAATGVAIYYK